MRTAAAAAWPEGQRVQTLPGKPRILITRFTDIAGYHPGLARRLLAAATDARAARRYGRADGGTKIHDLARLGGPELALVEARALELCRRGAGFTDPVVDLSWANIYGNGDYIMPHSHPRAHASAVYCLDEGDLPPDPQSIDGEFCFVDPRYSACCHIQPDCMTMPIIPGLRAGCLILFPGQLVHAVNPYFGERPRITLSWNLTREKLPGSPWDDMRSATLPKD
jgi:hypothetical protein